MAKGKSTKTEENKMSLEEMFVKLDETIAALENNEISLNESFELYKSGMDMIRSCNEEIDTIEKKVLVLNDNGETDEF